MKCIEIFSGCGGLAFGMSKSGFNHKKMVEFNSDAIKTIVFNKSIGVDHVVNWPISEPENISDVDWSFFTKKIDVIAGGPPCQPFGIGGKKNGHQDKRDMWPETIRAIREVRPNGFLFENVRNLAGPKFKEYLEWITYNLMYPSITKKDEQSYNSHLIELKSLHINPDYSVLHQVVNAADYGAPQIRNRVIIFGIRRDISKNITQMTPTHSKEKLLWDKYITGDYWDRHQLKRRDPQSDKDLSLVFKLKKYKTPPATKAWVTIRDAISGLGEPNGINNHCLQPGAKVYPGHTGSLLDMPSKALKAGDHGVPGGENMAILDNGCVRYFSTREAARLVGMPDSYQFPRSWTESMRQLGNAVPVALAEHASDWLKKHLEKTTDSFELLVA